MAKFKIGRINGGGTVKPAFTLQRLPKGGIRFSDIEKLSDAERTTVQAHFGREMRAMLGLGGVQHWRKLKPGTDHHFNAAVTQLPHPFVLMAGSK